MKNNNHITVDESQPTMALTRIACGFLLTAGAVSAETISEVGAWPGYTRQAPQQVAGNATIAYLVGSKGLQIFDLSSPAQPQSVSFLPCVEYPEDPTDIHLQAESNRVCIGVINPSHLKGIDVSDAANPTQVWTNSLLSWPNHVYSDKNDVYSSHNSAGLSHSSWSSALSGHRYSAVPAYGRVAVVSNRVYVPTTSGFDVRDKNSLTTLVGTYNAGAWVNALAVEGDYAYLAATNGLHVVNIQNEAAPVSEGVLELAASAFEPTAVGLVPGHACLVFKRTNLLMTVNVESPKSPTAVGSYVLPQPAEDLSVSDERALVLAPINSSSDKADLYAIDLSVPGDPILETRLHLNGTSRALALAGNTLFVAEADNGLCILDVVTPSDPGLLAHQPPQGPIPEYASVAAADDLAFLGDLNGFSVFDISNPEEPLLVTNFWDWTDAAQYLQVARNHLFTVGGGGFAMLTVRDVTNDFAVVGTPKSIMNEVRAFGMAGDQFVLLLEMDWTFSPILEIIDAQSPDLPTITNYSGGAEIVDVVGHANGAGTNAFLATTNGLKILDLGDPNNIHSIGEWNCPAGLVPTCICVDGNRIGLASTNHLWIIDRNELGGGNPIIAETDIAYSFSKMILSGTDLYAAASADGVIVYRIGSAPSRPTLVIADNPPNQVTLEWNAAGTGWFLQHSGQPDNSEAWDTVTGSETVTSTNLPRDASAQFFRLKQP